MITQNKPMVWVVNKNISNLPPPRIPTSMNAGQIIFNELVPPEKMSKRFKGLVEGQAPIAIIGCIAKGTERPSHMNTKIPTIFDIKNGIEHINNLPPNSIAFDLSADIFNFSRDNEAQVYKKLLSAGIALGYLQYFGDTQILIENFHIIFKDLLGFDRISENDMVGFLRAFHIKTQLEMINVVNQRKDLKIKNNKYTAETAVRSLLHGWYTSGVPIVNPDNLNHFLQTYYNCKI